MSASRSTENKNTGEKELFALVKWIGGAYDKTCTAGVPVGWIFDLDPDTFNPDDNNESYVIEWRDGKKPKNGWIHFDAKVLQISNNLKTLKNQIKICEGKVSPLRPVKTLKSLKDKTKSVKVTDPVLPQKRKLGSEHNIQASTSGLSNPKTKKTKISNFRNSSGILNIDPERTSQSGRKNTGSRDRTPENNIGENDQEGNHSNDDIDGDVDSSENELVSENEDDDETTSSRQSRRDGTEIIMRTLLKLRKEIKEVKETQANMMNAQMNKGVRNENRNEQVEIGHEGSQVFVTRAQWDTADSRDTFEKMGVSLVSCLFETEVLLASNLRGGQSKINKNAPRKPALNGVIISAIEEAVKNKFPATFKKSLFGMAINDHITALRRKNNVPAEADTPEDPIIDEGQ